MELNQYFSALLKVWVGELLSATNCPYRLCLLKGIALTAIKFHMKSWSAGMNIIPLSQRKHGSSLGAENTTVTVWQELLYIAMHEQKHTLQNI